MPVRETAAIRLISTTAGVVMFWVLRKMLSLPVSRVVRDDDAGTVYITSCPQDSANSGCRWCALSLSRRPRAVGADHHHPAIAMTLSTAA